MKRDDDLEAYLQHATENVIPNIKTSTVVMTILSGKVDAKICLELGAAILLEKPLIILRCGSAGSFSAWHAFRRLKNLWRISAMKAQFQIAANDILRFEIPDLVADHAIPTQFTYRYSCCPFGWGTIYELQLQRYDEIRAVAIYEVLSSRSEKS